MSCFQSFQTLTHLHLALLTADHQLRLLGRPLINLELFSLHRSQAPAKFAQYRQPEDPLLFLSFHRSQVPAKKAQSRQSESPPILLLKPQFQSSRLSQFQEL